MDTPNPSPDTYHQTAETTYSPEVSVDIITELFSWLEFVETTDLAEAKRAILELLSENSPDPERKMAAWTAYAEICEKFVDSINTGTDTLARSKLQLALVLHKALIFQAARNTPRYIEELDMAETYADDELRRTPDDNALVTTRIALRRELDLLVQNLELSPEILLVKLKGVISELNREFLRDGLAEGDDLETLINNAYAMIENEGGDADTILKDLGILE